MLWKFWAHGYDYSDNRERYRNYITASKLHNSSIETESIASSTEWIVDGDWRVRSFVEARGDYWKFWWNFDHLETCDDAQDGRSFQACRLGCPHGHVIHNQTIETAQNILADSCSEGEDDNWIVRDGTNNTDAEVIIDMGWENKIKGLQMTNIKKEQGSTKKFSVFLSESLDDPWQHMI